MCPNDLAFGIIAKRFSRYRTGQEHLVLQDQAATKQHLLLFLQSSEPSLQASDLPHFEVKDSRDYTILAASQRKGRSRPVLTDSWADVESDEDASNFAAHGLELDDSVQDIGEYVRTNGVRLPEVDAMDEPRRSSRLTRPSVEPDDSRPIPSRNTASASLTPASQAKTPEPQLIMPSILSSGTFSPMPGKRSPLSASTRLRRAKTPLSSASQITRSARTNSQQRDSAKNRKKSSSTEPNSPAAVFWSSAIAPLLRYSLGVFGHAMLWLKPLFGIILAIALLFAGFKYAFDTSLSALSSIPLMSLVPASILSSPCNLPIINTLPMCTPRQFAAGVIPEFEDLMNVQSDFEEIIHSTAEGAILPIEMKRSEGSIRDLKYLVTYSHLPSKNELVFEFQGFVDTAKQASTDLTRFNSRVGRAIDHIISANKHTLNVLDSFESADSSQSALGRWLWPFASLTDERILHQYLSQTTQVDDQIAALILEAQVLLKMLSDLDARLDLIHSIVVRDGVQVKGARDELFAQLWTRLGGNKQSAQRLEQQLELLTYANRYRSAAWRHVSATLLKLQEIHVGLEDLRERVAAPEVLAGKAAAEVGLRQHIETIKMGLDRLERARESGRTLEDGMQRKILGKGDLNDKATGIEGKAKSGG